MNRLFALAALATLTGSLFLGGCGSPLPASKASTVVHADGSFERTVELSPDLRWPIPPRGSHRTLPVSKAAVLRTIRRDFSMPDADGKVMRHQDQQHAGPWWNSRRSYSRGEAAVHDIVIKSPKGEPVIANEAYVRPMGDGRWVFVERYHWIGKPPRDRDFLDPTTRVFTKQALGPGASTLEIDSFSERIEKVFLEATFRPERPKSLSQAKTKAEQAAEEEAWMAGMIRRAAVNDSESQAASRLAHRYMNPTKADTEAFMKSQKTPSPWPKPYLQVDVRVPGRVVQTDAFTDGKGHYSWSFSCAAVAVKDVVLSVVYRQ